MSISGNNINYGRKSSISNIPNYKGEEEMQTKELNEELKMEESRELEALKSISNSVDEMFAEFEIIRYEREARQSLLEQNVAFRSAVKRHLGRSFFDLSFRDQSRLERLAEKAIFGSVGSALSTRGLPWQAVYYFMMQHEEIEEEIEE